MSENTCASCIERTHQGMYVGRWHVAHPGYNILPKFATWGRSVNPSGCLISKRVCTESKRHATNNIVGQIKEHVFGKRVREMHHQGPGCKWCALLLVVQLFTIVLSRVSTGEWLPIMQMPVPEIQHKTTEVNGLKVQQIMLEDVRVRLAYSKDS